MEDEIYIQFSFTKEEFKYIRDVIQGLAQIESKIPKKIKTEKSIILKQLNNRFSQVEF